eukprot:753222-Rhodomonas_salina.1
MHRGELVAGLRTWLEGSVGVSRRALNEDLEYRFLRQHAIFLGAACRCASLGSRTGLWTGTGRRSLQKPYPPGPHAGGK